MSNDSEKRVLGSQNILTQNRTEQNKRCSVNFKILFLKNVYESNYFW